MDKTIVLKALEEIRKKLYETEDELIDLDEMIQELEKEVRS